MVIFKLIALIFLVISSTILVIGIIKKKYKKSAKKKKSEKIDDIAMVLQKYGIQKSEKLLNDILEAQRGQTNKNDILKVVKRQ